MAMYPKNIGLHSFRQLRTDQSAFTLFELLVVCALISVMLVVTVPTLRNTLLTDPLKSSSRQIVGMIKGTRELAIREQQPYLIHFDLTNSSIWAEQEAQKGLDDLEGAEKKILQLPQSVRFLDVWTSGEGKLESGRPVLLISKQGYMDQTMIHLGDDDDEVLSLLFSPFIGNVQVFDSYAELD